MSNTRCPNCMEFALLQDGGCGSCGFDVKVPKTISHTLKVGTALNNRYMVGKILGEGGFGITYLGLDTKYDRKVAIKEYFPNGFVRRGDVTSATTKYVTVVNNAKSTEFYAYGKDKFIKEGQNLSRFAGFPGIVSINDLFTENNTAYIIMEFLEGKTLKQILKERNTLPETEILALMKPVIKSLAAMHDANIMHRDIAPDNIIVTPEGMAKLIDFGSTAEQTGGESKATVALVKHGFAPEEQYSSDRNRQGSWTDVYALSATIYRALTGTVPVASEERLRGKELSPLPANISPTTAQTVTEGLALYAKDRIQNMYQLYFRLYGENIQAVQREIQRTVVAANQIPVAAAVPAAVGATVPVVLGGTVPVMATVPVMSETTVPAMANASVPVMSGAVQAVSASTAGGTVSAVSAKTPPQQTPNTKPSDYTPPPSNPDRPKSLSEKIGTGYFVVMIIGLIASFGFAYFALPFNIPSLVRCIKRNKEQNTTVGIVLNIVAIVIAVLSTFINYAIMLYIQENDPELYNLLYSYSF